ncbi:MAG: hypothetical protein IH948_00810, partial [Bacteroidetes bacterium]|nr:hypothetical protein [Bacteroidota bacterium]
EYTFKTNWTAWLRTPYDVKVQKASVSYPESLTSQEREAIIRKRDLHHRSETYTGISDFRLLIAHRFNKFLSKNGRLDLALGTSIPFGKTEENPLLAGDEDKKHLHIQFGSGTFDPLLELHYVYGDINKFSFAVFTINKISLYQNKNLYQGSYETTSGISMGYRLKKWLIPRLALANFSQSRAKWDGVDDPNSGLISFNATATLTFKLKNGLTVTPGYRHPLVQKTLAKDGDTFAKSDIFDIKFDPKDASVLYSATSRGLYKSVNS